MEWINYHHLLYFWTVAKEGSVARACERLRLAQPTISGQLRALEENLGEKLFVKSGRGLALTEVGQVVYRYADEIFTIGRELADVIKGRPQGRPLKLVIGISEMVPKLIAYRILEPAMSLGQPIQLICHEGRPERLLTELSSQGLDLVLTDAPIGPGVRVRAFNHLLGTCPMMLVAAPTLAVRYRKSFPASLDGAPFLLPVEGTARRALEQWFDHERIRPQIVGEFQDGALMKVFGQAGAGIFAIPSVIQGDVRERYRAVPVGTIESITETFYAISIERRLKHPGVIRICEMARQQLFGGGDESGAKHE